MQTIEWADNAGLRELAQQIADELKRRNERLVLAESCSGGLAAAALVTIPGISQWFCGSLVAYRDDSKSRWLEIDSALIAMYTSVSIETTRAMAETALRRTPEADWSAAITGHLGPDLPPHTEQLVHTAVASRSAGNITIQGFASTALHQKGSRQSEQIMAAGYLLVHLYAALTGR